jgi:hypothetical protein
MKITFALSLAALLLVQASGAEEASKWPPDGTASVRAFSFAGGPKNLIINGDTIAPTARPNGGLLLTREQAADACAALNTTSDHFGYFYRCFEPRDALVFYDADGAVLASVSICFTCYDSRAVPSTFATAFDYAALTRFFARLDLGGGYKFHDASASDYAAAYRKKVDEWKSKRAKASGRPVEPEPWKFAKPNAAIRLGAGDQVYIATNIPYDEFDGIKQIDPEGHVHLNLCKASVMVAGLTEVQASDVVRTATIRAQLYNDHPSFTVSVVIAHRFPTAKNKNGQQDVAPQSATRSEADSEGGDKPQPESEPRLR